MCPAKTDKPIEMPFGADSGGPKEPCVGSRSTHEKGARGNFGELTGPLKSMGSLCCSFRIKMDHFIINNGMQQKRSLNPQ